MPTLARIANRVLMNKFRAKTFGQGRSAMTWAAWPLPLVVVLGLLVQAPVIGRAQDLPADDAQRPANPEADKSIRRALDYLRNAQRTSGAWTLGNGQEATSVTSLSVMAFLACGHSPGDPGPYQESIQKGIRYVVEHQQSNGLLATNTVNGPMYCHGISTLMLAEVIGMIPDPKLDTAVRESLSRAIAVILRAQAQSKNEEQAGGWRYQPDSRDSDLSVSGWQVMALRAARSSGCAVPAEAIDRAVGYIIRCANPKGGFGYQPGGSPNNPRTGTGTLALELCGTHQTPEAIAGAEFLVKPNNAPNWTNPYFFYVVYYVPQALFQVGDKYFRSYYPNLVAILLEHQEADGSWLSNDGNDRTGGRNYCTAMGILALAVEYRYLPIYQR